MKFFALLSIALFSSFSSFAQLTTDTLLLHMPFNGNATDETGNGNNGAVQGATLTDDRFGQPNSAYSFDGIDDYIDVNNATLTPHYSATINFWFAANGAWNSSSDHQTFVQSDIPGDTNGDFLIAFNRTNCGAAPATNDGKIYYELQADAQNGNSPNCPTYGLTSVPSTINTWTSEEWNMITAIVHEGRITIYVNGALQNTQICTSAVFVNSQNLTLGRYFAPQQLSVLNGALDDLRIYGRALTQNEITALLNESPFSSVNEMVQDQKVTVYPNPTTSIIHVDIEDNTGSIVKVKNVSGQLVKEIKSNSNSIEIDLETSSESGVYFVEVYNEVNELVDVSKLIVL